MKKHGLLLLIWMMLVSVITGTSFNVQAEGETPVPETGGSVTEGNQENTDGKENETTNQPVNYVYASSIHEGNSYVLAAPKGETEEDSFAVLTVEEGSLTVKELSELNETTVSGMRWTVQGEYGVYSLQYEGSGQFLYLDGEGWKLSNEDETGWEYNGQLIQYTSFDDECYGLLNGETPFWFFAPNENSYGPLLFSASQQATERDSGTEGTHYIAIASDRHGNTQAISQAMGRMPVNVEYVSLIGDLVGSGGGSTPSYSFQDIYEDEVKPLFSSSDPEYTIAKNNVSLVWGSHDMNVTDVNDADRIFGKLENSSKLIYTSTTISDQNTVVNFYVYAVAFYDMQNGSEAPANAFKTWVDTIGDNTAPIIVLCHMPIHANRGDNQSAMYWHKALNYAATGSEEGTAITRDVIFLHGHNHTTEHNREYFYTPGASINVPEAGKKDKTGTAQTISYTYITGGYLNANKTATLIGISENSISFKKYSYEATGDNVATFDTSIPRVTKNVPWIGLNESLLNLVAKDESAALTTSFRNVEGAPTVTWTSSNPSVASVDNGTVTPLSEGNTTITASITVSEVKYSATCEVYVEPEVVPPSGNAYVPVSTLSKNKGYLIVSTNQAGRAYALKNDGTAVAVTVHKDSKNGNYIVTSEIDPASLQWISEEAESMGGHGGDRFVLNSNGKYLSISDGKISISDKASMGGFKYENSLLSARGGGGKKPDEGGDHPTPPGGGGSTGNPKLKPVFTMLEEDNALSAPPSMNSYYISYNSTANAFTAGTEEAAVYLFERTDITINHSDSSGSSNSAVTHTDNVVTCQMAGYPAGYEWNEEAKACQAGYIDAQGRFRARAIPNTADDFRKNLWIARLVIFTLISAFCAEMLYRYQ